MNTQSIDLTVQTGIQSRAAAVPAVKAASRLAYLDIVRALMCVLVIMVHAAVTYGSLGDWTYIDQTAQDEPTAIVLSFFLILCQCFFMGLFFFISGYFTPKAFDRKGLMVFWKDRLLRLAVPFLAYTLLLSKVPNYLNLLRNHGLQLTFLEYCQRTFWQDADAGPTWFLFALLVFSAAYSLWRLAASRWARPGAHPKLLSVPRTGALLGFAALISAGMFAVSQVSPTPNTYRLFGSISIVWAFFPQYILMFTAGILAYRNGWLEQLPGKSLRFWAILAGILAILLPVFFILGGATSGQLDNFWTGLHWQSIVVNLWIGLACVSISMTLILWSRSRFQTLSAPLTAISTSTFATYLIHPLVLVPITVGLSFWAIHPMAKFGLASALTIAGSFAAGIALRKIPGLKTIL